MSVGDWLLALLALAVLVAALRFPLPRAGEDGKKPENNSEPGSRS